MAEMILVTGGCRSGKSSFALATAEEQNGSRLFVATCPLIDEELRQRAARHQAERKGRGWKTEEETLDLAAVLNEAAEDIILVDCLTLWINNLMYEADCAEAPITEDEVARRTEEVVAAGRRRPGTVLFVTNETGMGVTPANAAARLFRDLAGRCNQVMAAGCEQVHLLTCGIPTRIK
jgi:adenosylcobinamide kinase/adenosylcobinamide-phosphate guanylyltransferase